MTTIEGFAVHKLPAMTLATYVTKLPIPDDSNAHEISAGKQGLIAGLAHGGKLQELLAHSIDHRLYAVSRIQNNALCYYVGTQIPPIVHIEEAEWQLIPAGDYLNMSARGNNSRQLLDQLIATFLGKLQRHRPDLVRDDGLMIETMIQNADEKLHVALQVPITLKSSPSNR